MFLGGGHMTTSSTETAETINFKLCTHISKRLLHKTMPVFPNKELLIFYCHNSASFESIFCLKTAKSRLFNKSLKKRKSRARFCLSLGQLHVREKKTMENCNSVGAGAHKIRKVVSLWPNFEPNFLDIWNVRKA